MKSVKDNCRRLIAPERPRDKLVLSVHYAQNVLCYDLVAFS